MEPKTNRILSNICFFLMAVSLLAIVVALRYSYEINPDPIITISLIIGLVSAAAYIILRRRRQ